MEWWGSSYQFGRLWTPQDIPGWQQLFIADPANVTVDGSSGVSQWSDLSGNNYHATQSTSANRPVWSPTSLNGGPGITGGNPGTKNLVHTATQPGTAFTAFLVIADMTFTSSAYQVPYASCPANNALRLNFYTRYNSTTNWAPSFDRTSGTNTSLATSTPYILTASANNSGLLNVAYDCRTTGISVTNTVSRYAGDSTDRRCIFAQDSSGTSPQPAVIGACGFINSILSTADLERLEGWAAHKWGFTGNLPSNHPYKTAAPTV